MSHFALRCNACARLADAADTRCAQCGGTLLAEFPSANAANAVDAARKGMWRYRALLPIAHPDHAISLGEGGTPLVRSRTIGPAAGLPNLYFKVEGANPTGSYKDRIASVGISCLIERGMHGWAATSSGNSGAALAAYGARAGVTGQLFTLETAPRAKLTQILAYGPRLTAIQGLGKDPVIEKGTFAAVQALCKRNNLMMQITAHAFSPIPMEGAKTIAFELAEQLGRAPDAVYVPSGGGGLLSAVARGFAQWQMLGLTAGTPRMVCVQAAGCDPIAQAWREDRGVQPIPTCTAKISGIQLTAPPDGDLALAAVRDSNGWATSVPDDETYAAQRALATQEGLFVEPAAATGIAALLRDARAGHVTPGQTVVCVLTGVGFKDAAAAQAMSEGVEIPLVELREIAGG